MPHFVVNFYPGRDAATKQRIAEKMQTFAVEELNFSAGDVSVGFVEVAPAQFVEEMNKRYQDEELVISSDYVK